MAEYIERGALMQFPIRRDHYDRKNGNKHFINGGANRRANAYFAKVMDYQTKLMQYRVELRICSRVEWYILHRRLRMKRKGGDNGAAD